MMKTKNKKVIDMADLTIVKPSVSKELLELAVVSYVTKNQKTATQQTVIEEALRMYINKPAESEKKKAS